MESPLFHLAKVIGEQRCAFPRMGVEPILVLEEGAKRQGYLSTLIAIRPRWE